jgi:DNA sulfur modification protein DndE
MSIQRLPDAVRISTRGREILIKLKRHTGIGQWNILCRFAYCYSLAIGTKPTHASEKGDFALEIEWDTFAGPIKTELAALTIFHATKNRVEQNDVPKFVRSHIERGLSGIQNVRSVTDLVTKASADLQAKSAFLSQNDHE